MRPQSGSPLPWGEVGAKRRVRGLDYGETVTPHPNPLPQGEGAYRRRRTIRTLSRYVLTKPHIWARQAEMRAEGFALVSFAKQAALAQERDHLGDEEIELMRQHRRHQVEAVGGLGFEPVLHDIGDLFRRPGD